MTDPGALNYTHIVILIWMKIRMKITQGILNKAVEAKIINSNQASALITFIKEQPEQEAAFNLTNVLYYCGGLIAIGAMTLFMNLGWETFGGFGILFLSVLYGILGLSMASKFHEKSQRIPAGICATFVVALTPLAIYGFQLGMGWWPDDSTYQQYHYFIKWHWIFMEFGTLIVGIILVWIYRYPFMLMPVAVTLWYMSMDLASMIAGGQNADFTLRAMVSMYFGLVMVLIAFWVDIRSKSAPDYAFWLYVFGVMAFWCGITSQSSDSELSKFLYMCLNLLMIGIGVLLVRRVFVIFGAIGCTLYLGHLASAVFQDSTLFPVALTAIGFLIIYLGTIWQKHESKITKKVQSILPLPLQELLQSRDE